MSISIINPLEVFKYGLTGVFLFIDGIVYWAVSNIFEVFESLARVEFLTQGVYKEIVNKFMVIIGVFMLFYLSYSLLKSLINPDDFSKNTTKLVTNLIFSLVLLGVMPVIFTQAFKLQTLIIDNHILDKVILGQDTASQDENYISKNGNRSALNILNAFLNPDNANVEGESFQKWNDFKNDLVLGYASFMDITDFAEKVHEQASAPDSNGKIVVVTYAPLVSALCGIFLCYVILSFSIDLGVRVAKLAFYQILAPIPIIMRVIPEKKSVFDNWTKGTVATYLEVYIRIFIMLIVVFLASVIFSKNSLDATDFSSLGMIGKVIVVMGLFAAAKQAPKMISDITGIDSGNIKLGIGGKLAAGGAFGLAAVAGGAATATLRNFSHGFLNKNNWKNKNGDVTAASILNNVRRGALSTVAGMMSGATRSVKSGFTAKNFNDMRNAAGRGAQAATTARDNREAYRASHGDSLRGVAAGHVKDMFTSGREWVQGGFEAEERKIKYYNEVLAAQDKAKAEAEKLREKNANRAELMEEAYKRTEWKGNAQEIFDSLRVDGHAMSLDAIRSYIESYSKRDTTGMSEVDLRKFSQKVADYKSMLNQLEKGAWQTIESAAFDSSLMNTLKLDENKLSGVKKEVDNMNNIRKSAGQSVLSPDSRDHLKDFNEALTEIENLRNNATADLEAKKRAREARQQNNNSNSGH